MTAGPLTTLDVPSAFTRDDVAETIGESWTWAPGKAVIFSGGDTPAPPLLTGRSTGTRIVIHPHTGGGTTEYAVGIQDGASWISVPIGGMHKWYCGATERLRLDVDGTVRVVNGSGNLELNGAGSGHGLLSAPSSLYLQATAGAIVFTSGARSIIPSAGYVENLGSLQKKWGQLHAAELWVETLVAQNTIATIGGRVVVGKATILTRDITATATTIYVKHNAFSLSTPATEYGSKLVLEAGGQREVMAVTSETIPTPTASGDYAYTVIRGWQTAIGVWGSSYAWTAGDAVADTGRVSSPAGGFIDLYSIQGLRPDSTEGPTIVGNVRSGHYANEWRENWAVGNLKDVYGNATRKMGAAFGDRESMHLQIDALDGIRMLGAVGAGSPFVYGHWALNGNLSLGYGTAGQLFFESSTGALRIKMNGVEKFAFLGDGFAYLQTGLVVGQGAGSLGVVRSVNATGPGTGNGFYFEATGPTPPSGYAANTTKCLIGNGPGRRLTWDGSNLFIASDGFYLDATGFHLQPNTTGTADAGKAIHWGTTTILWDTTGGADPRFEILRVGGRIRIEAQTSGGAGIELQAGGSGVDRIALRLVSALSAASTLTLAWDTLGGYSTAPPRFVPQYDALADLGSATLRWNVMHAFMHIGPYGQFGGATTFARYLELGSDSAGKPVSSTWYIIPSERDAKDEITRVDPDDALALVRRIPLVRYRYNGRLGSPVGERGIGVVAEDLAPILPASVSRGIDGTGALGWNAHEMFTLTTAAVQALAARLDTLEGKADRS